jgi:hypothetical protein
MHRAQFTVASVAALGLLAGSALAARPGATKMQTNPRPRVIPQASWNNPGGPEVSHTFPTFNQTVDNDAGIPGLDPEAVNLTGAPAGTYTGFSVSVQWSAISGDPWSSEAIWALTNQPFGTPGATFYADPGPAANSGNNGNPAALTWSGFLDAPYTGGTPLIFLMAQTFSGSAAQWDGVTVTINDNAPVAPPSTPTFVGGSLTGNLSAGEVQWFSFAYSGSGALDFNTLGTTLSPNNDTEIGLYSAGGVLIDTNDDIDLAGGNLLSRLTFSDGELPAGTYYLALGGFNTDFGPAFNVVSTSSETGPFVLNGLAIPEPASLAGIAIAALFAARRRRA